MLSLYFLSIRIIGGLSCSSFFGVWIFIELNLISFVAFLWSKKLKVLWEAVPKYFLVQSIGSAGVLLGLISQPVLDILGKFVIVIFLIFKLGGAPFHFWFISISQILSAESLYLLFSVQKFLPLYLFSLLRAPLPYLVILVNILVSTILALKSRRFNFLISSSSVFRLSWILTRRCVRHRVLFFFIIRYSLIIWPLISNSNVKQSFFREIPVPHFTRKLILRIAFFGLIGVPPSIIFFIKILVLKFTIEINIVAAFYLLIGARVFVYVYTHLLLFSRLKSHSLKFWESPDIFSFLIIFFFWVGPLLIY